MDAPVGGTCAPGFEPVRDAVVANLAERGEVGTAVCVMIDGEPVVDLWAGWQDEERTRPWESDTLVAVYSVGKALVATELLQLVDEQEVSLETRVAEVWPEFSSGGKEAVTIADALSHRGTVPAIRELLEDDAIRDWDTMAAALADTPAWWEVGTRHAYHVNTYGHLVGEVVRRVSGEGPGERLRRIAEPLDADVFFGVPEADLGRIADTIWVGGGVPVVWDRASEWADVEGDALMYALAHFNPPGYSSVGLMNTTGWRTAVVPSTNGHASARGLARFYAALIEPDRLLSPDLLALATRPHSIGPCPMLKEEVAFGLGFTPTTERRPLGTHPRSFGHFGTGGALGFADPDAGLAFGYVMNHTIPRWQSSRNRALIDALYASLP